MENQILGVYAHNNCKAGHQLMINHFVAYLGNEYRGKIKIAIENLLEDGLLETKKDKHPSMLFLTEKGEATILEQNKSS